MYMTLNHCCRLPELTVGRQIQLHDSCPNVVQLVTNSSI